MHNSSNHIIELLTGDPEQRQQGIRILTRDKSLKEKVVRFVQGKGGTAEEAVTIYHDSLMALVKAVIKRNSKIENLQHYMIGIAKFKWYDTLKARHTYQANDISSYEIVEIDPNILDRVLTGERAKWLRVILSKMKINCKEVLLYWANGYNMQEIADKLNYKSPGMVRKKKSQCLKQVIEYITNNPELKNVLKQ